MSVTLESATADLIAAIDAATHEWLVRCVMKTYVQQLGTPRSVVEEKLLVAAQLAAEQGRADGGTGQGDPGAEEAGSLVAARHRAGAGRHRRPERPRPGQDVPRDGQRHRPDRHQAGRLGSRRYSGCVGPEPGPAGPRGRCRRGYRRYAPVRA